MANTAFIVFRNVTIPVNARITRARVGFYAYEEQDNVNTNLLCYFEDADNPNPPTDKSDLDGRSLTDSVPWPNIEIWRERRLYYSPWVHNILQDVIDRSGWSSGNKVMFIMVNNVSDANSYRIWSAFEYKGGIEKAFLEVYWIEPKQIDTPSILPAEEFHPEAFDCAISTFPSDADIYYTTDGSTPNQGSTLYIGSFEVSENTTVKAIAYKEYWNDSEIATVEYSFDPGWVLAQETYGTMGVNIVLGYSTNSTPYLYYRKHIWTIEDVLIPQGATITSAVVNVRCAVDDFDQYLNLKIAFEDTDNASAPTSLGEFNSVIGNLGSSISWLIDPGDDDWLADNWYDSVDFSSILQQIVNRSGWSSGNTVNLVLRPYEEATSISKTPNIEDHYRAIKGWGVGSIYVLQLEVTWVGGSDTFSGDAFDSANFSQLIERYS
jgi:hypothetical protein